MSLFIAKQRHKKPLLQHRAKGQVEQNQYWFDQLRAPCTVPTVQFILYSRRRHWEWPSNRVIDYTNASRKFGKVENGKTFSERNHHQKRGTFSIIYTELCCACTQLFFSRLKHNNWIISKDSLRTHARWFFAFIFISAWLWFYDISFLLCPLEQFDSDFYFYFQWMKITIYKVQFKWTGDGCKKKTKN